MKRHVLAAFVACAVAGIGAQQQPPPPAPVAQAPAVDIDGKVIASEKQTFKIEVLTRGLETPWGIAFLPDGRLLVTERPGRLRILDKDNKLSEPVKGTPTPHVQQDGGLLDVTVHPQYASNGWIYLSYSELQPGFVPPPPAPPAPIAVDGPPGAAPGTPPGRGRGRGPQMPSNTVIVRGKLNANNEWIGTQTIFRAPTELYSPAGAHFGSRFLWDQQNHLFFSIGDRGTMTSAQDLGNPHGKIHRVNDDGTAPRDNPFVNRAGALPTIWSYGHRNPQGLAWDPVTGKLWESEHGPTGGDEINLIEPGRNYGWAVITLGNQNGITERAREGMEQPVTTFPTTMAPSALAFYTGTRYPGWRNNSLFLCTLVGQQLRRLEVSAGQVTHQEAVLDQMGRVHDVIQGADGLFYVALQSPTGAGTGLPLSASTPGSIVRLVPVQ
jgi:glucose/arabinose dehydrogenase